jgi:rod shape determining protein RodA
MVMLAESGVGSRRRRGHFDAILALGATFAAVIGVIIVYSATRGILVQAGASPSYYLKRQALFVVLGIMCMAGLYFLDYRYVEVTGIVIYWVSVALLLGVLVPGIGKHALGSTRWYSLGPLQLQPSEFAVLGLLIGVSTFCSRRVEGLTWRDIVKLLGMGAVPIGLVLIQPDLGTSLIMTVMLLVLLAVAGIPNRIILLLLAGAVAVVVLALELGLLHHYQITRITSFLHQSTPHPSKALQTAVYNLKQAKETIGAGGMTGTGLFHGSQTNLGYVPEQQTDFIFTAIGEQLGFIGSVGVLAVMGIILWRCIVIAQRARDRFGRLLAMGFLTFLAFSVFQNAGMTMGIMPITGIPLPFISYGGTAVIAFFCGTGLVLSVAAPRRG